MTDDLPTPPLPEATAITRVVGGTAVSLGALADVPAGLAPWRAVFSSWVISVHVERRRASTPGSEPTRAADVRLDLRPQRAAGGGEGDGDGDRRRPSRRRRPWPCRARRCRCPSSGSITPAQHGHDVARRWERGRRARHGFYRRWPCNLGVACSRDDRRASARHPEGARRQHPLRDLPRAGPFAQPAGHRRDRRDARPARQHGAPPPRAHARRRPARGRRARPAAASAGRSTATRWPPTRRRSGSSRRRSRCSPGMLLRAADAAGTGAEEAADAGPGAGPRRRRGRRRRHRPCLEALIAELDRLGLRPGGRRRRPTRHRSPSPTARSASWPRPTPTSCAACTAAWSRASSRCSAATRSRSWTFHTLVDRTPCQVELADVAGAVG